MLSDSQKLVKAIQEGKGNKETHGLLHDIIVEASLFSSIYFKFIPRKENIIADSIPKEI